MAWKNMTVTQSELATGQTFSFESTEVLLAAGDSSSILIPQLVANVIVTAEASGGATACVYSTTDPVATVKSGTGITWLAWHNGNISTPTASAFFPVTAIKMTQIGAGSSKISVRAQ
jgi:hypothetical protein